LSSKRIEVSIKEITDKSESKKMEVSANLSEYFARLYTYTLPRSCKSKVPCSSSNSNRPLLLEFIIVIPCQFELCNPNSECHAMARRAAHRQTAHWPSATRAADPHPETIGRRQLRKALRQASGKNKPTLFSPVM